MLETVETGKILYERTKTQNSKPDTLSNAMVLNCLKCDVCLFTIAGRGTLAHRRK